MAVAPRKLKGGRIVYWVAFKHGKRLVWERSGFDKRAAERLDALRKKEVREKRYQPKATGRMTVRAWFNDYLSKRTNRSVENDRALIDNHVLCRAWFADMPLQDVEGRDCLRLVQEMRADGRIKGKSIAIVYSVVSGAFAMALFEKAIATDPSKLPRGTIRWKSAPSAKRRPYTRAEAHSLIYDSRVAPDGRMFMALAFFTGMREGEVCGRRWRDWFRDARPLSGLSVHSQYLDQPLKTDEEDISRPRMVPVHPELEQLLRDWWSEGWEFVYTRPPTLDDWIVPRRDGEGHTKSSGYKLFARALKAVELQSKTLHATRNTFTSVARSNGARKDVVLSITHNPSGDIIDVYTEFEWRPLCEAVAAFDLELDPDAAKALFAAPEPGLEKGATHRKHPNDQENSRKKSDIIGAGFAAVGLDPDARFDASQRRLLKLAEVDPEAAATGLALYRGLAAARRGDEAGTVSELRRMAGNR